ncbi:MAG: penicillin-binding protein activator LpoB [Bdellovibrionales bacterium]|nr:penicillin-binding protein activator LpoB [Bdellovibrionales bacterium]
MKYLVLMLASLTVLSSCGPKAFVRGEYEDANETNLMTDKWSESDMQRVVDKLVKDMVDTEVIRRAKLMPIIMVTKLENKTSEHIDTQSIMDMVKVEIMSSKKAKFIDKEARDDIADEYNYQNSGMVSKETLKGPGGQTGADLILNGRLDSITQQVGKDKTVYYKVTFILTNLRTGVMEWSGQDQIRKRFLKQRVGF